jgi:hypothetical protein
MKTHLKLYLSTPSKSGLQRHSPGCYKIVGAKRERGVILLAKD